MTNQVYANSMEVSCKAAAGKSVCAFPDVCMTPPQTPATPPGVPIPYPNTGVASDTSDGSTSVKISGQEVMLKNKSAFSKSTGDEAGCAPMKGVVTHKITGKVYFAAWSMDVRFEGESVVRTLDLMTHNHGSVPGNSPTWPYLDEMSASQAKTACGGEMDTVQDACKNCQTNSHADEDCPRIYANPTKNSGYKNDECVKAKRCMLVPYSRQNNKKGGCCPGQTAHHLVPKHHFTSDVSKGYCEDDAPCVCVEGHSWHRNGDKDTHFNKSDKTHADMHDIQDAAERAAIDDAITLGDDPEYAMNYEEARDQAVDAHEQCFMGANCSADCLKAQLNAYHRQKSVGVRDGTRLRTKRVGASG